MLFRSERERQRTARRRQKTMCEDRDSLRQLAYMQKFVATAGLCHASPGISTKEMYSVEDATLSLLLFPLPLALFLSPTLFLSLSFPPLLSLPHLFLYLYLFLSSSLSHTHTCKHTDTRSHNLPARLVKQSTESWLTSSG